MQDGHGTPINWDELKKARVTVPFVLIALIFIAGWKGRPMVITYLATDFVTTSAASETEAKTERRIEQVEAQITRIEISQDQLAKSFKENQRESRAANALAMLHALRQQLDAHESAEQNTLAWRSKRTSLVNQKNLAEQYSSCILEQRENCELLQRQLMAYAINANNH